MAYVGLRFEDHLDGASNFCSWRERIGVVFEEQGVWAVEFWYLGKWSPSVIECLTLKGEKVTLTHFTLCYKVKVTL
jgi:hypothetical protein